MYDFSLIAYIKSILQFLGIKMDSLKLIFSLPKINFMNSR